MHPQHPQLAEPEREADWKVAYLRRSALLNAVVSLFILAASVLLHVPDIRFLLAAAAFGVCAYFTWSKPKLKQHLVWLVPLMLIPAVFVAVEFSEGTSKSIGLIQLMSTVFASLSACFLLEAQWGEKPVPQSTDEA